MALGTDLFSALPEGFLPKWFLFTSALGIFNSIQNFCTDSLTKRVYAGKPDEGNNELKEARQEGQRFYY